ncbi:hypothetical protein GCM10009616_36110 [Microlunatus lacustris]
MSAPLLVKRDCRCIRAQHRHGTDAAYRRDKCRCTPCRRANARREKRRAHLQLHGHSPLTDATPVRAHLEQLLAAGLTLGQIERRSGIHRTAMRVILGNFPNRRQAARVRYETAAALLAVTAQHVGSETGGLVAPIGTVRRAQALVAIGWTRAEIARRIGVTPANSGRIFNGDGMIKEVTRRAVLRLYNELWDKPAPGTTSSEKRCRTRALAAAAQHGWVPPLAWDDDTIDDASATPWRPTRRESAPRQVDEILIQRALAGQPVKVTAAERRLVIDGWRAAGRSLAELNRIQGWNAQRDLREAS